MYTTPENTDTVATLEFTGQDIHKAASAIFATIGSVMILSGFFGNWLLIAVVFKQYQSKRCVHNLFIVNLALADMLTLVYWFTFFVLDLILGYHPIVDNAHCVVNGVIIATLCVVSVTSLVSISLNRYLHVCYSHLYSRIFTPPRTICCCVVTWLLGVILALPPIWNIAGSYRYNPSIHFCSFSREERISYGKIIVILFSAVPMVFVGYWNFSIFRFWKQARMSLSCRYPSVRADEKRKKNLIAKWVAGLKKKSRELEETKKKNVARLEPAQLDKEEESSDLSAKENSGASGKSDGETTLSSGTPSGESTVKLSEVPEGDSENSLHTFGHLTKNDEGSAGGFDGAKTHSSSSAGYCSEVYQEAREVGAGDDGFDENSDDTNPERRLKSELEWVPQDVQKRPPENAGGGRTLRDVAASPTSMLSKPSSPKSTYSRYPELARSTSESQRVGPFIQNLQRRHRKKRAREVAFVRSLFVVFILVFICFIPYGIINIISSFVENVPPEVVILGNMLLFFNNSVNWIVYGVMNPVFRKGYIKYVRRVLTMCCRVGRERPQRYLNTSLSNVTTASSQRLNTEIDPEA